MNTIPMDEKGAFWPGEVIPAARELARAKREVAARVIRDEGYATLAQVGHDLPRRGGLFPARIPAPGGDLELVGCGFRGPVYLWGDYALKVNYNLSFEVQREWEAYCECLWRVRAREPADAGLLERNLGLLLFPGDGRRARGLRSDPAVGHLLREDVVLVKGRVQGRTITQVAADEGPGSLADEARLRPLAALFFACGEAGVLLQADAGDFMLRHDANGDENPWVAIDPDGWVAYEPGDPYVRMAARRGFVGTFERDFSPRAAGWAAMSPEEQAGANLLMDRVREVAEATWGPEAAVGFDPGAFRRTLEADDLLAPGDARLRSFIRAVFHDPLKLDVELGRCSLNVMLTTRELLSEVARLRGRDGELEVVRGIYFGDLDFVAGARFAVVYNAYNDVENERSGDWAYNHTGVTNREIAERVLRAAETRFGRAATPLSGP